MLTRSNWFKNPVDYYDHLAVMERPDANLTLDVLTTSHPNFWVSKKSNSIDLFVCCDISSSIYFTSSKYSSKKILVVNLCGDFLMEQ